MMPNSVERLFTIRRVTAESEDSDTATFEGIAASDRKADDGLVLTRACLADAITDYLQRDPSGELSGPLRAQHRSDSPVGKILAAEAGADGLVRVTGVVLDPLTARQLRAGLWRALSVRGRILRRSASDPTVVERFRWIETSLVDVPGDAAAKITMVRGEVPRFAEVSRRGPGRPEPQRDALSIMQTIQQWRQPLGRIG